MHHTQPQEVFPIAGANGSIDGFKTTCACGLEMTNTSFESLKLDVARHVEWHSAQPAKRKVTVYR